VLLPFILARFLWTKPHLDKMGDRQDTILLEEEAAGMGGASAVGPPEAIKTWSWFHESAWESMEGEI
jgi:hypothetical protein